MSIEVPVVMKNNPRSKPLNGLISASICVRKFVSANNAPARNAPSWTMKLNLIITWLEMHQSQPLSAIENKYQTVSLKPNCWVRSEVPATVSKQRATKASELLVSATTWKFEKPKLVMQQMKSVEVFFFSSLIIDPTHLKNSPKNVLSSKREQTKPT